MIKYLNDKSNNLVLEKEVNGIRIQLSYRPSSLLVLQELHNDQKKDTVVINRIERKYNSQYYFILKFSKGNKEVIRELGGFSNYSSMLQVFAFDMQNYINITTPRLDTIPVSDYFFDQSFGTKDGNTILLSFSKAELVQQSTVDVNLSEFGLGIGNAKFTFRIKDLENIPTLNYSL